MNSDFGLRTSDNKEAEKIHRGRTEKTKEFTYKFMISVDGSPEVPLHSLTEEELTAVKKAMREKLSRGMSEYYSIHPEEYSIIKDFESLKG